MRTTERVRRALLIVRTGAAVATWLAVTHFPLAATQTPVPPPTGLVRLDPNEAERLAKEARAAVSLTMAAGLEVSLWAPAALVKDPIAIDIDNRGVMYVTSSPRTALPLDIRRHTDWVPEVHTLT